MGSTLYNEFLRTAGDAITKGRWYNISAACSSPRNVGFRLHSFGDSREDLSREDLETWDLTNGIDGFMEFECDGYVSYPDTFVAKPVNLLVNPVGSLDRFKLREKGSFGGGWYDGKTFLIRLYLDLHHTRQLLAIMQQPTFQSQNSVDVLGELQRDVTGYDPSAVNIRFDLFNLHYQERPRWTSYDVCRIYV